MCVVRAQFVRLVFTERTAALDAVNIVVMRRLQMRHCVFETELVSLAVRLDGLVTTATRVRDTSFQCTLIALITFIPSFMKDAIILDFNGNVASVCVFVCHHHHHHIRLLMVDKRSHTIQ